MYLIGKLYTRLGKECLEIVILLKKRFYIENGKKAYPYNLFIREAIKRDAKRMICVINHKKKKTSKINLTLEVCS